MALVLYHHGSSACAAKVRFALAEKALPWESRYVDILRGEQFAPAYVALNPKAVVPTLVHDGAVVVESTVICEYLEEVFLDNPLYPKSPLERAHVRVWTKAVDEELHPPARRSPTSFPIATRSCARAASAASRSSSRAAPTRAWPRARRSGNGFSTGSRRRAPPTRSAITTPICTRWSERSHSSEWLVGERFSMADVAMAPYVNRLAALSMTRLWQNGRLPRVERWFERVAARHYVPAGVRRLASRRARRRNARERRAILARGCRAARDRNVIAAGPRSERDLATAGSRRESGLAGLLRAGVLHELDVGCVEPGFRHHQRLRESHGIRERERDL